MPAPIAWSIQTRWPSDPRHVRDARRFVAERLDADALGSFADTVGLVVSELVTNAVRHANSPFRVTVARDGDRIVVEVHDESPSPPALHPQDPSALGGRGLHLVSALSVDWGVTPHPRGGKTVWACLDVADSRQLTA